MAVLSHKPPIVPCSYFAHELSDIDLGHQRMGVRETAKLPLLGIVVTKIDMPTRCMVSFNGAYYPSRKNAHLTWQDRQVLTKNDAGADLKSYVIQVFRILEADEGEFCDRCSGRATVCAGFINEA